MKEPKVAIIVINFHKEEKTLKFIESVKELNYKNYSITVVDNESEPDSFKDFKYKYINIIRNPENTGWAGGFKLAVEFILHKEKPDYFLLSNNDILIDKNMLKELVETAQTDEKIGFVAPTLYDIDNRNEITTRGGYMNYWLGLASESKRPVNNEVQEVDGYVEYLDDCVSLIKREVMEEVGFHDPIYFLYSEDIDWNIAIKKAGFRIMHNPNAKAYHEIHGSSEGKKSPVTVYYNTRNRSIFMRKHKPFYFPIFLLIQTFVIVPAQFMKYIYKKWFNLILPLFKGYFNGVYTAIFKPKFHHPKL